MRSSRRSPLAAHRPYEGVPRLLSMILMLAVLAAMYYQARKPSTWRWLAPGDSTPATPPTPSTPDTTAPETVVPGPTDQEERNSPQVQPLFEAVTDRAPIAATDMPAYWRCMTWARAQTLAQLQARAQSQVRYGELWEQPDQYRGKLIGLRLHVRRILMYPAPENSAGVDRVYEIWGGTDESKSHPYVVLVSELPPGLHVGSDLAAEAVFAGYFLKLLSYSDTLGTHRAAPLLIGRIKPLAISPRPVASNDSSPVFWIAGGALLLIVALRLWMWTRPKRPVAAKPVKPADEAFLAEWYRNNADAPDSEPPPHNS